MARAVTIDDRVFRKMTRRLAEVKGRHVKVGVLASKGGGETREDDFNMVDLAVVHEFGSPATEKRPWVIPERSFIRRTFFDRAKDDLKRKSAQLARKIVEQDMPVDAALNELGAWGAAEVKKTITTGPHIPPKLEKSTIARKGSDRPLVDTGRLVGAIQWEVGAGDA